MVQITREFLLKRAEHNDGDLESLEEITLHQFDIEKLELLDKFCPNLEILLLQNNVIGKIENIQRLHKLKYINLALNNITVIEGLDRLENLFKLDLTVNFISDLSCVNHLKPNYSLREMFLLGNPCTEFPNYRAYVINALPQLEVLDGTRIERSERIKAARDAKEIEMDYQEFVMLKRCEEEQQKSSKDHDDNLTGHTPEGRLAASREAEKIRSQKESRGVEKKEPPKPRALRRNDGSILQFNEAEYSFLMKGIDESDEPEITLDITLSKFIDSSLLDLTVEKDHVLLKFKGKPVFQVVIPQDIDKDKSEALRSQCTGHLVIRMPKLDYTETVKENLSEKTKNPENQKNLTASSSSSSFSSSKTKAMKIEDVKNVISGKSKSFEDNPEVPPLE